MSKATTTQTPAESIAAAEAEYCRLERGLCYICGVAEYAPNGRPTCDGCEDLLQALPFADQCAIECGELLAPWSPEALAGQEPPCAPGRYVHYTQVRGDGE